jgi:2-polyprenyl-6-methoxyphenol hydroxylase-like FAD-dependent oxidoreductase
MPPANTAVIIAGGGPCGLMMANELGRRGISAVLVDEKSSTAFNPQANATQARTMEHFRRLGFADEIRALGMPHDYPTDIAYFTRFAGYEIARFALPSAAQARQQVASLTGSWSAAELPHRVSQKFVETVLRRHATALPGISVHYGWRMVSHSQDADGVTAELEDVATGTRQSLRGLYLFAADGARSPVRAALGYELEGEAGTVRDFMGGRMHAIYVSAPDFYQVTGHQPAWMNVTFNRDRRAFMAAVDGRSEFAFHTQLRDHEDPDRITDADALGMFAAAVGKPIDATLLARGTWIAGRALVANHYRRDRVLLGGDAVHLFTPAGGLGYNTAVGDAVNLGWKLAAVLKGQAPAALLDSYEAERRPIGLRNTGHARRLADSLGYRPAPPELEEDSPAGAAARAEAGAYFNIHARAEFNIPGITFGDRYDGSPIIVGDGSAPPPDSANIYQPSACPGGRPPHAWLSDESSLYDRFGFEWTLLRLGDHPPDTTPFARAAERAGIELAIIDVARDDVRDLYERDLVLIRPDQVVAWRGNDSGAARAVLDQVRGA